MPMRMKLGFLVACAELPILAMAERFSTDIGTKSVGNVSVVCADAGSWRFATSVEERNGMDVLAIDIKSDTEARPPRIDISFSFPGDDIHHIWTPDCNKHFTLWPTFWDQSSDYVSQLAYETPVLAALNSNDEAKFVMAASEAFNKVAMKLGTDAKTCVVHGGMSFFTEPMPRVRAYTLRLLLDRRKTYWGEAVSGAVRWIGETNGFVPASVPAAAYAPLYSTWYAWLQDVHADDLEREAELAASLGMKTMILDDGWQMEVARDTYDMTGDWQPARNRFPDMRKHVAAVQRKGLKYMLWLAVPFVGERSQAWNRFRGKTLLEKVDGADGGKVAVLDPRFPEVREYLVSTYEKVVRDWGFDGVKLDFVDEFVCPSPDPAESDNFAGRDIRSMPVAVDVLMKTVLQRLRAINPDAMIEFRQHYSGPAIRQYGNMIRAMDCPNDFTSNRRRICDLRLTCGNTAVHSDMLVWSTAETPVGAAKPILSAIFGVVQYSMALQSLPESHRAVIRHWLQFSQAHRETLLQGDFRPHRPDLGYPLVEAESQAERIVAVYLDAWRVETGPADRPVCLINASDGSELAVRLAAKAARVECFDVTGRPVRTLADIPAGLTFLPVPASGYAKIMWVGE